MFFSLSKIAFREPIVPVVGVCPNELPADCWVYNTSQIPHSLGNVIADVQKATDEQVAAEPQFKRFASFNFVAQNGGPITLAALTEIHRLFPETCSLMGVDVRVNDFSNPSYKRGVAWAWHPDSWGQLSNLRGQQHIVRLYITNLAPIMFSMCRNVQIPRTLH